MSHMVGCPLALLGEFGIGNTVFDVSRLWVKIIGSGLWRVLSV